MIKRTLWFLKITATLIILAPLAVLVGQVLDAGFAKAQSETSCTLATIAGTYLFHGEGVTVSEGKVLPYAEAGIWTLDGEGKAEGFVSGSINGEPFATRQAFTATYELTSDCVYKVVDQFDLEFDMYTTSTGTPMTYFSPGFSGVQLKQ